MSNSLPAAAIDYAVLTAGSFNILVEAVAEDDEHLLSLLTDPIRPIGGGRSMETFVYLRLAKQAHTLGAHARREPQLGGVDRG